MSKITKYLNEHLVGSASDSAQIRQNYSTDGSVLSNLPDFVVIPATTSDIRKVARFSWQLAEKGHVLGLTVRGLGTDTTGAATGTGAVIDMSKRFDSVLYVAGKEKNKFVHAEAGITTGTLQEVLRWHGLAVESSDSTSQDMTLGGAIAAGIRSGRSAVSDQVERLEVVLANGDLMEVGKISKRDINKKRGEQTFEGEIYRQIDTLFEDEAELIGKLSSSADNLGYSIDKVKAKDGSYNLAPLFVGSQGTLGIISEVVLKAGFYVAERSAVVVGCQSIESAQDTIDKLLKLDPAELILYSPDYLSAARAQGKKFVFDGDDKNQAETVVLAVFDDFTAKAKLRKLKRVEKMFEKDSKSTVHTSEKQEYSQITAVRDAANLVNTPMDQKMKSIAVMDGAYLPSARLRDFLESLAGFAKEQRITTPFSVDAINSTVALKTALNPGTVAGKQQVFRLANAFAKLVAQFDGSMAGSQAEGRLVAQAAYGDMPDDIKQLNDKIRKIFDPYGTLNPGVKQSTNLKTLAAQLGP